MHPSCFLIIRRQYSIIWSALQILFEVFLKQIFRSNPLDFPLHLCYSTFVSDEKKQYVRPAAQRKGGGCEPFQSLGGTRLGAMREQFSAVRKKVQGPGLDRSEASSADPRYRITSARQSMSWIQVVTRKSFSPWVYFDSGLFYFNGPARDI